jgi:hypothetical protein
MQAFTFLEQAVKATLAFGCAQSQGCGFHCDGDNDTG